MKIKLKDDQTSYIRTLTNGQDQRLQFLALNAKDGCSFYVLHLRVTQGPSTSKKNPGKIITKYEIISRGASKHYPTLEAGGQAVEAAMAKAITAGPWVVPEGPKGFVAKPDEFDIDSLPKPLSV